MRDIQEKIKEVVTEIGKLKTSKRVWSYPGNFQENDYHPALIIAEFGDEKEIRGIIPYIERLNKNSIGEREIRLSYPNSRDNKTPFWEIVLKSERTNSSELKTRTFQCLSDLLKIINEYKMR